MPHVSLEETFSRILQKFLNSTLWTVIECRLGGEILRGVEDTLSERMRRPFGRDYAKLRLGNTVDAGYI